MGTILNKEHLDYYYTKCQLTDLQIARLIGCNKNTVFRARKRFGVRRLEKWERHICEPTCDQKQIMMGSLLGDASVTNGIKNHKFCHSCFEVKHCSKQKEYLFWKHKQLSNLCPSRPQELSNGQWRLRTFNHPYFSNLRKIWYPENRKHVLPSLLQEMEPLGLAVWYLDDGTLIKSSDFMKISTCSYSDDEHVVLSDFLIKKFGISSHMAVYSGYRNLIIDVDSRKRFANLIQDYIIPSMMYKIQFKETTHGQPG